MAMLTLAMLTAVGGATGSLNMTHTFGDNMVLDFGEPSIHGFAAAGATVNATFAGRVTASATADASGAWRIALGASACAGMPRSKVLVITSAGATATARNVACGQVFICTGERHDCSCCCSSATALVVQHDASPSCLCQPSVSLPRHPPPSTYYRPK
jgi:hypothetical protein